MTREKSAAKSIICDPFLDVFSLTDIITYLRIFLQEKSTLYFFFFICDIILLVHTLFLYKN